ncbi:MAG: hypothetical protein ACI396_05485 [Acutalibacteraceae bacterium]
MNLRYFVEFKAMPQSLFSDPEEFVRNVLAKHEAGIVDFYDSVCSQNGVENPYAESDFRAGAVTLNPTHFVFKIDMPENDIEPPLCHSIIITFEGMQPHYYTEEYEDGNQYFLGEVAADGTHIAHGPAPDDEHELLTRAYSLAFGWDVFSGTQIDGEFAKAISISPTVRNFVENLYMKLVYFEKPGVFLDNALMQSDYYFYSVFHRAYELAGQQIPYNVADFKFMQFNTGNDSRYLFAVSLPRGDIQEGDAIQIIFAADTATDNVQYLTLEYESGERAYICLHDPDSENVKRAIAPSNNNALFDLVMKLAFE